MPRRSKRKPTETKTRKLFGRTWTKTKQYDDQGRKTGKSVSVQNKEGEQIRYRQKDLDNYRS